ncbi:MAG: PEGA domain-containing protein, partial [Candidatus Thermoplasmatota archaeon]|nr:PEGA domain-containing protein [Candidatus Thermoplasmatota archaeon]
TSSINESYYVSYGSGLYLNATANTSIYNATAQITATNVPLSSPPPFTVGMMTSTSYAKYKILSTAPNGNFTANVTTTTTVFSIFEPGNFNGTFQNPENLPALNLTDLNQLNAGKVPPGMDMPAKNVTVETGVTVTVPGGTFISDKISGYSILGNNTTKFAFYISSTSGVFILGNFNFSMSDNGHTMIMNESLSLSSTNIPMESTGYGFLKGTITPTGATLVINGMIVPTYNGASYNISLKPGNYYVSASKSGYQTKTYNVNISAGKTTQLNVILASISNSVTLSGHVTPVGSSVLVDGYMASVNATGYYTISVPAGEHTVSVYHDGYFPTSKKIDITSSMTLNFNLLKEPSKVSSNMTRNATTAIGYNVTVSDVLDEKGFVAVNFTATKNGTLLVSIPYNDMKNATISEVLNSSIYINGVKDKNFSITITSNYTVILKVYNLSGDPTLYWTYSPAAVLPTAPPPPFRLSILEEGIIIGAIVAVVALVGVIIVRKKNR